MGEFKSRFRGYNVLDRWSSPDWDDQTREVIRRRLHTSERDRHGLPVAHVIFNMHEKDHRIVAHAKEKMREILQAAGGDDIWTADRTAHLLGNLSNG